MKHARAVRVDWLVVAWLLASCDPGRSTLAPAGPAARRLAELGWPILIGFTATAAVMWGLLAWATLRRSGSLDEHAPATLADGTRWIWIGGVAIPAVTFAATFVATIRTLDSFPVHDGAHHPAEIRLIGHQWWWEVQYLDESPGERIVTTANEIHIPAGRAIEIALASADVIHSFWVPRLHGKVDLVPGQTNRIRIEADAPGTYQGLCAELCGAQHSNMRFLVVADDPPSYERWLAHEREPATQPTSEAAQRGRALFVGRACLACHTIRGTDAHATVGPDLTHLGARSTLAAASLPNDVATLHAWVTNAPSLKPGTKMPALPQFTGDELHDLVAYLRGLT